MNDLIQALHEAVVSANGSILWDDLLANVDYKQRPNVPNALKLAKAQGLLQRRVEVSNGKSRLFVEVISESTTDSEVQ